MTTVDDSSRIVSGHVQMLKYYKYNGWQCEQGIIIILDTRRLYEAFLKTVFLLPLSLSGLVTFVTRLFQRTQLRHQGKQVCIRHALNTIQSIYNHVFFLYILPKHFPRRLPVYTHFCKLSWHFVYIPGITGRSSVNRSERTPPACLTTSELQPPFWWK